MAQNPHEPTDYSTNQVKTMASVGTQQDIIALVLGIGETTLKKYYADELTLSGHQATAKVGAALYNSAIGGVVTVDKIIRDKDGNERIVPFRMHIPPSVIAQIFWMKTRAGWKDSIDFNVRHDFVIRAPAQMKTIEEWEAKVQKRLAGPSKQNGQ